MASQPEPHSPAAPNSPKSSSLTRYWQSNLRIMGVLLLVWALVGLGCGVLWADLLNHVKLGGFPLGFWFAQQGSILVFVLIILIYGLRMNRLDRQHHAEYEAEHKGVPPAQSEPTQPSTRGDFEI